MRNKFFIKLIRGGLLDFSPQGSDEAQLLMAFERFLRFKSMETLSSVFLLGLWRKLLIELIKLLYQHTANDWLLIFLLTPSTPVKRLQDTTENLGIDYNELCAGPFFTWTWGEENLTIQKLYDIKTLQKGTKMWRLSTHLIVLQSNQFDIF